MSDNARSRIPQIDRRNQSVKTILEAAEQEFAELGFKGATLRGIAARAQLPKTNVQYYFQNKLNLYQQVLQAVLDTWMAAANQFDGEESPDIVLRRYIGAKMDLARSRPNGSKVWANEILNGAPIIQDRLDDTLKPWVDERCQRIQGWIDEGLIKPVEPRYFLYMIWASTQHYADFSVQIEHLNHGKPLSEQQFEQAKENVIELLLKGVLLEG